ncbi:MAG: hypothetical protein LBH01_01845 [Verrucomicrobiales bacterium]|jgi:hypothetical protein|nr:hypothetical protein [Verrucomicrobiales bacterium]
MRWLLIILCSLSAGRSFAAFPPLFPVEELKPGMHGKTLTVMQGTQIVELDTEILGVQHNAFGPGKDLIIAKLVDEKTKLTEAVHGMSGSPLYIDGKLVGALSRRLGSFEKDGHCGFTPIKDMIDVGERKDAADDDNNPFPLTTTTDGLLVPQARVDNRGGFLSLPLAISGWNEQMQQLLAPLFPKDGLFMPVAGGSSSGSVEGAAIAPGSPLAVVLISGDINAAGTGTVTAMDGDKVLAFGHPMFGVGSVEFPFAQAEIISVLPSYEYPYKLSNTGKIVGTLKQDRLSAVAGKLGVVPKLASYEIDFTHNGEQRPPARGQMATDYRVVPLLLSILMSEALEGGQDYSYKVTLRLNGEITFSGLPPVKLDGVYSGGTSARMSALFEQLRPVFMMYSQFPKLMKLEQVKLSVQTYEKDSVWSLDSVSVDKDKVEPLGKVRIIAKLKNDLGKTLTREFTVKLNEQLKDGDIAISVGSGADLQRHKMFDAMFYNADSPEQIVKSSQREYRNDGLYVRLLTYGTGINRPDQRQTDLPPSIAQVNQSNSLVKDNLQEMPKVWSQQEVLLPGVVSGQSEVRVKIQ